jgi:hypothetical protein
VTVAWQAPNHSFVQGYVLELDDGSGGEFRVRNELMFILNDLWSRFFSAPFSFTHSTNFITPRRHCYATLGIFSFHFIHSYRKERERERVELKPTTSDYERKMNNS